MHVHEVAVQTTTQVNLATVQPRLARTSGAIEYGLFRFQRASMSAAKLDYPGSTLLAVGITPTATAGFSKGLQALPTEFIGRPVYF